MNNIIFRTLDGSPRWMQVDPNIFVSHPIPADKDITVADVFAPYVPAGCPFFCRWSGEFGTEEDPNAEFIQSWELDWDQADGIGTGEESVSIESLDEAIHAAD